SRALSEWRGRAPKAQGMLNVQPLARWVMASRAAMASAPYAIGHKPWARAAQVPLCSQDRLASAPVPTMPASNSNKSWVNRVLMTFLAK
ncbi:MAG: hypothetical protein ACKPKO_02870, partial [Candidatus Fonsibacter sp.]